MELGDAAAGFMGLTMAWLLYVPSRRPSPRELAAREDGVFGVFRAGLGLDALYTTCVAWPYRALSGVLWRRVDRGLVDGSLTGLGGLFAWASERARPLATGSLSLYLSLLAVGLALLLGFLAAWAR